MEDLTQLQHLRRTIAARRHIRPHRPVRIVWPAAPELQERQALAELRSEADATRWWLLEKDIWSNPRRTISLQTSFSDEGGARTVFPLAKQGVKRRNVKYFLDSDSTVLLKTRHDGIIEFDPEQEHGRFDEIEPIIDLLRAVRRV